MWSLILLEITAAGRAEFDQCRVIDQVLNRLGNAMAINSAAFRIVRAGRGASPFGLHRTLPGDSRPLFNSRRGTNVCVAALVQRWLRWLDSVQGLEVAAITLRAEREDVATPMRHRREPPRGGSVPHSLPARPKHWRR